jgi:hypothetical protein
MHPELTLIVGLGPETGDFSCNQSCLVSDDHVEVDVLGPHRSGYFLLFNDNAGVLTGDDPLRLHLLHEELDPEHGKFRPRCNASM